LTTKKPRTPAEDAIAQTFERIGGTKALVAWGKNHKTAFYTQHLTKTIGMRVHAAIDVTQDDDDDGARTMEDALARIIADHLRERRTPSGNEGPPPAPLTTIEHEQAPPIMQATAQPRLAIEHHSADHTVSSSAVQPAPHALHRTAQSDVHGHVAKAGPAAPSSASSDVDLQKPRKGSADFGWRRPREDPARNLVGESTGKNPEIVRDPAPEKAASSTGKNTPPTVRPVYPSIPGLFAAACMDDAVDGRSTTEKFMTWRGHGRPP
jgi:hypothetical protein